MRRLLTMMAMIGLLAAGATRAADAETTVVLDNARTFLLSQQRNDGSFGLAQPHLQTGLATLALMSLGPRPESGDQAAIEKAVAYLVKTSSRSGDLGDDEFALESHSVVLTALMCALPNLPAGELHDQTTKLVDRGLKQLQRMQDRSSSSASRGGWKMEGFKGRENDRRATAWGLLAYETAIEYGIPLKEANVERAVHFIMSALKENRDEPEQVGGLSVDTEGLAVASISSMGGWVLARVKPDHSKQELNLDWLHRHPAVWSGPNYFYANFFRIRAWMLASGHEDGYERCQRRLLLQVREHQASDGSVGFPPGNAQNTVAMGPAFSTAAAILIVNAGESRLVFDQDWRVRSLLGGKPASR